jgi:hypothetical protein
MILGFVLGAGLALGAVWLWMNSQSRHAIETAGGEITTGARKLKVAVSNAVAEIPVSDIREELARTGRVVRQRAGQFGDAVVDAAGNSVITASIKAKLVAEPDLSALSIHVSTTAGLVTLSGMVSSHEQIARAMRIALDTEGVREVISTLQVRAGR